MKRNQTNDQYTYFFATGETAAVTRGSFSGQTADWILKLCELDRQEYNIQHKETRRHCSLEAQDPKNMGGYYEGGRMNEVQLELEADEALRSLPKDLEHIARRLLDGYAVSEIARQLGVNRTSVYRKIWHVRQLLEKMGYCWFF